LLLCNILFKRIIGIIVIFTGFIHIYNHRQSFIGKPKCGVEKDNESSLGDFGVRKYDDFAGRFFKIDPLWEKYYGWTPYHYSANNPISRIDPDGFEPVKKCAGTVLEFAKVMNSSPSRIGTKKGKIAADALISLGETEYLKPVATPYFNEKKGRYIYTTKGGWIDMVHFLFYAGKAYKYKNEGKEDPIGEAVQDGYMQENLDGIISRHSSFSYEDLPSDKFGATFAVEHFDPNSSLSLSEQIIKALPNIKYNNKSSSPD